MDLSDDQLLRYSRHILLPELGIDGQTAICNAHALVVGAGGLGSPVSLYLASAGVGTITICDADEVDLTNLQRQVIHDTHSVGQRKVDSAAARIKAINPEVKVNTIAERVARDRLRDLVKNASVVLDCCDNFETRHAVNRACVEFKRPLVSGAAIRFDGQVSVFDKRDANNPCYHCLFPQTDVVDEVRCAVMGVFAPITGIVGTLQAAEALKIMAGIGESLQGRLITIEAQSMEIQTIRFPRDAGCAVCGTRAR